MPDAHKQQHQVNRNRKSVTKLQLDQQPEPSAEDSWNNSDFEFSPVPLTARSTALSFAATQEAQPAPSHNYQTTQGHPSRVDSRARSNSRTSQFFSNLTTQPPSQIPRQMAMAAMSIISPRSGNYDRLEGGMGPSRMGANANKGWRRFGWKKFAIGATALIVVVWLWGPRESTVDWKSVGNKITNKLTGKPADAHLPPIHIHEEDYARPKGTSNPTTNPAKSPLSHETDPDPAGTTFCTVPHPSATQIVQYALMIDAGSTGSRIHVYKFNNCGPSPAYEYEVFKMTQPGLSAFAGRPAEAARSLDVLMDVAVKAVPEALHHCTPVAVKATAGLRLLPGRQSHDILERVEERLRRRYGFAVPEKDGVVIMDGKDEGVYAWITANYLLGTISAGKTALSTASNQAPATYAVLDLGGASTQIVFEPNFTPNHPEGRLEEGEHKYDLDFGGKKYELYQHSYLGYGLMRARAHVHRLVDFMASIRPGASAHEDEHLDVVANPCIARGRSRRVTIKDEDVGGNNEWNVTMQGSDVGSFEACDRVVQLVLAKDAVCEMKPCSFNGVYQPSLLDSFQNGKVLLLSYFYDRLAPLLIPGSKEPLSVGDFAKMAKVMCGGPEKWKEMNHWVSNKKLLKEIEDRPEYCLDLTFMHGLLRLGYEFDTKKRVDIGKKIRNTELGWCLGATIAMVTGGQLKCTA